MLRGTIFRQVNFNETLPPEIKEFVKKHNIQLIYNDWDSVFGYLFTDATLDVVGCALQNSKRDERFNQVQKDELESTILNLCEKKTYLLLEEKNLAHKTLKK